MTNVNDILAEREKTHGSFEANARISSVLKDCLRTAAMHNDVTLREVHWEALDMICLKLSRILSGKKNEPDHWDDIAGYATLVANWLRKKNAD